MAAERQIAAGGGQSAADAIAVGPAPGTAAPLATDVTQQVFRDAMARLAATVHVITTDDEAGRAGATVTAVSSVTDEPPTLLVCLNRRSSVARIVGANGVLAVNALRHGAHDLSSVFAGQGGINGHARFRHGSWSTLVTGAPLLDDSIASFDCRISGSADLGTHTIFHCRVVAVPARQEGSGLVYVGRRYTTTA